MKDVNKNKMTSFLKKHAGVMIAAAVSAIASAAVSYAILKPAYMEGVKCGWSKCLDWCDDNIDTELKQKVLEYVIKDPSTTINFTN